MSTRWPYAVSWTYVALIMAFLYGPILVMISLGFNQSPLYQLPFKFDLVWLHTLLEDTRLMRATGYSVGLAVINAVVVTVVGIPAALVLARRVFRGRTLLYLLLLPPITIPWLILAVAMLLFFTWTHIGRGLHAMLIGHMGVSLPYVVLVLMARLHGMNPDMEDASASLGAVPLQTFARVTLPLLLPGLAAGFMFAFIVSFDNFVISYFLAAPGVSTLPVEIYSSIRTELTPEVNVISAVIFAVSTLMVAVASRLVRLV